MPKIKGEEIRKFLKDGFRTQMSAIWEKAKERDFEGLDDEKQRIAKIMVEHEDELYKQLEHADLIYDPELNSETEYDPFLHITIHSIIEAQLEDNDPLEIVQFFNAMRQKKYSRHDSIHLVGQILTCLIFEMLEHQKPFDLETYRKLLNKYKSRNPEKLMDLLENEPLLSETD
ncbi:MAG: DUF1841 family protein [Deltaproteobacteria bacterium]|nr:DUF1841 family protein [Deltaproteobacteria bacterium]